MPASVVKSQTASLSVEIGLPFCWSNPSILSFAYGAIPRLRLTMVGGAMRPPLMQRMPRNTTRYYPQTTLYNGLTLHLVCDRPARGERILLIRPNRPQTGQWTRWAIETTFACLKSRGFNLEDDDPSSTHICCWDCWHGRCYGHCSWASKRKPSPLKKHGRPAISLFRRGLDQLGDHTPSA